MKKIFTELSVIACFLLLLLANTTYAQNITVKGTVKDEQNLPIPGVSVLVKGTSNGVQTDASGNYTINASGTSTLVFSSIGFVNQEVPINKRTSLDVKLSASSSELDQVVVMGYGTSKKRDLTGSIVKIEGKEVADKPNANPVASLQGKVAGLSVVNTGRPGQEPDIRIRGTVSRYQTKPLYVVDGIFNDDISFINPNDIESIEVLKDASSLAIFGVRGANGVIIVSTKQGKSGRLSINLNSSVGVKNIVNKPKLADADLFKALYDEQRANDGFTPYSSYAKFTGNTDWVSEIANKDAMVQNTNLSIQNSTEKSKFSLGLGQVYEEGLTKNELFKKYTFNLNNELTVFDNLKIKAGINGYKGVLPASGNSLGGEASFNSALHATPIVSAFNDALGVYNQLPSQIGGAQIGNPLVPIEAMKNTKINNTYRILGNISAELKFLKDFTLSVGYLGDFHVDKGRGYTPVINVYAAESNVVTPYSGNMITSVQQYNNTYRQLQQDYLLTYKKTLGDHDLSVLAGYTVNQSDYEAISGSVNQYVGKEQIPNDPRWWYLNVYPFGDPATRLSNSSQWDRATLSSLFRVLYNYKGKYFLNASFRRDETSQLPSNNRGQNFWAVGAAWDLTKEDFMKNQTALNYLKIKGSFGQLGNQYTTLNYPYYPLYKEGSTAVFGETLVPAYVLDYRNDSNLKWETVSSSEGGFELAALKNRFRFEAAYYTKSTKDLLVFVDNGTERFFTNAGKITNNGLEFSASWNDKISDKLSYSIGGNLTTVNNKVNSVFQDGFEIFDGPSITRAGLPIGSFYGYVVEGLYQSYADILSSAPSTLGAYAPGDFKYKDVNGDGKITPADRTVLGNPTPDFTYAFNGSVNYGNFSLGLEFQGVYGNEIWRDWGNGSTFAQFNYRQARENRWTGAGSSNWEPRLSEASGYNKLPSSYNIEDGSYLRLRNVQLAYSFNAFQLNKFQVKGLKVFLNAQNLYTWKKNSGFSPEAGGSPTQFNVDNGGYPVPRITTLGLSVNF